MKAIPFVLVHYQDDKKACKHETEAWLIELKRLPADQTYKPIALTHLSCELKPLLNRS